jgi:hypothetical protein
VSQSFVWPLEFSVSHAAHIPNPSLPCPSFSSITSAYVEASSRPLSLRKEVHRCLAQHTTHHTCPVSKTPGLWDRGISENLRMKRGGGARVFIQNDHDDQNDKMTMMTKMRQIGNLGNSGKSARNPADSTDRSQIERHP